MNIISFVKNLFTAPRDTLDTRPSTLVGGGYYALQPNVSAAGITYTTLVRADKSKPLQSKRIGKKNALKSVFGSRTDRCSARDIKA